MVSSSDRTSNNSFILVSHCCVDENMADAASLQSGGFGFLFGHLPDPWPIWGIDEPPDSCSSPA